MKEIKILTNALKNFQDNCSFFKLKAENISDMFVYLLWAK